MGTKANPGKYDCHARAEDDEPLFTLLARDESAPNLVRQWAALHRERRLQGAPPNSIRVNRDYDEKECEALACADAMAEWRRARAVRLLTDGRAVASAADLLARLGAECEATAIYEGWVAEFMVDDRSTLFGIERGDQAEEDLDAEPGQAPLRIWAATLGELMPRVLERVRS